MKPYPAHPFKLFVPYLAAVDDLLRHPDDQPTIGIILCRNKKKTVAEYALRNVSSPIAVATHRLPKPLADNLPSVEQLEMEMEARSLK
jgi:hypothetical protein